VARVQAVVERFRFVGVLLAPRNGGDGESESEGEGEGEGESGTASAAPPAGDIWREDRVGECPPLKYEALRLAALQGVDLA
jgi:hypothetical protein